MNRVAVYATLIAALLATSGPARADAAQGRKLYEQSKCTACHARMVGGNGSAIYTRPQRRVHDMAGLLRQVRACDRNLGLTWFDDQIQDVADYLNATYYHFKE